MPDLRAGKLKFMAARPETLTQCEHLMTADEMPWSERPNMPVSPEAEIVGWKAGIDAKRVWVLVFTPAGGLALWLAAC